MINNVGVTAAIFLLHCTCGLLCIVVYHNLKINLRGYYKPFLIFITLVLHFNDLKENIPARDRSVTEIFLYSKYILLLLKIGLSHLVFFKSCKYIQFFSV